MSACQHVFESISSGLSQHLKTQESDESIWSPTMPWKGVIDIDYDMARLSEISGVP